ncbi:uracil phosphoribosyltransferase [Pasteurella sp. PK-2025]|uniref:uracil phosphoribosyltransferase n=1 Tax=unclassified Pasteurella TaxID=2621516 RepID=UPI003C70EBB0
MGLFILENKLKEDKLQWIEKCKSASMLQGVQLRDVHYILGSYIGNKISDTLYQQDSFAVVILMRAGLPFGLGIADQLEKLGQKVSIHFIYNDVIPSETVNLLIDKTVVLVDAVINSGKSIFVVTEQLPLSVRESLIVATTVLPSESVNLFTHFNLMAVRISQNKYKGAKVKTIQNGKGPDTGDRLFGTL